MTLPNALAEEVEQASLFGPPENFDEYARQFVSAAEEQRKTIYVNCWHLSNAESDALWRIYGGMGYGICIRTDFSLLSAAIKPHEGKVYGGMIKYLDEDAEIPGYSNHFYHCMWKRLSFRHEQEFRLVVAGHVLCEEKGIDVPIDVNGLVQEIIVDPRSEDWFVEITRDLALRMGCSSTVHRSRLLKSPQYF